MSTTNFPEWLLTLILIAIGFLAHLAYSKITSFLSLMGRWEHLASIYVDGVQNLDKTLIATTDIQQESKKVLKGIHKICEVQAKTVLQMQHDQEVFHRKYIEKVGEEELVANRSFPVPEIGGAEFEEQYVKVLIDDGYDPEEARRLARDRYTNDMLFGGITSIGDI